MSATSTPVLEDRALEEQVQRIVNAEGLKEVLQSWLRLLLKAQLDGDFKSSSTKNKGKHILLKIEAKRRGQEYIPKTQVESAYGAARQSVRRLSMHLEDYYRELAENASDRILILIPWEEAGAKRHKTEHPRYEPQVNRDFQPSSNPLSQNKNFKFIGDSVAALEHVRRQLPQLRRIEETFIRWVEPKQSLYEEDKPNKPFERFLTELAKSKVIYRAVLGPFVDPVVFRPGESLTDVLRNRAWEYKKKSGAKFFRLLHAAPIMSFSLLYYSTDPTSNTDSFYEKTNEIEVLYGFGIFESRGSSAKTAVFSSRHSRLCEEFQHQFEALRHPDFSYEISVERPHLFPNLLHKSDVIATFDQFPEAEIIQRMESCGRVPIPIPKEKTGEAIQDYLNKDPYPHGTRRPHVTICVSASKPLNDQPFRNGLSSVLRRKNVQVSIALWALGSPFLKLRGQVILSNDDPDPVAAEMEAYDNHRLVKNLLSYENLKVHECHGGMGSVSIFWIDDLIYFSPYWIGENVADGPHFLVAATSATGLRLQEQYQRMIATSGLKSNESATDKSPSAAPRNPSRSTHS